MSEFICLVDTVAIEEEGGALTGRVLILDSFLPDLQPCGCKGTYNFEDEELSIGDSGCFCILHGVTEHARGGHFIMMPVSKLDEADRFLLSLSGSTEHILKKEAP